MAGLHEAEVVSSAAEAAAVRVRMSAKEPGRTFLEGLLEDRA